MSEDKQLQPEESMSQVSSRIGTEPIALPHPLPPLLIVIVLVIVILPGASRPLDYEHEYDYDYDLNGTPHTAVPRNSSRTG